MKTIEQGHWPKKIWKKKRGIKSHQETTWRGDTGNCHQLTGISEKALDGPWEAYNDFLLPFHYPCQNNSHFRSTVPSHSSKPHGNQARCSRFLDVAGRKTGYLTGTANLRQPSQWAWDRTTLDSHILCLSSLVHPFCGLMASVPCWIIFKNCESWQLGWNKLGM